MSTSQRISVFFVSGNVFLTDLSSNWKNCQLDISKLSGAMLVAILMCYHHSGVTFQGFMKMVIVKTFFPESCIVNNFF
jgi:hypothetical protein